MPDHILDLTTHGRLILRSPESQQVGRVVRVRGGWLVELVGGSCEGVYASPGAAARAAAVAITREKS